MPVRPVALIVGMAAGLGQSLVQAFVDAGYDVVGIARSPGTVGLAYRHLSCDVTDLVQLEAQLGPIAPDVEVVVYNAQHLVIAAFDEITPATFEQVWRVACFGAMAVARIVLPHMVARRRGTLIFTGATASRRGGAKFAAFASAKFALRGLAQALAREYGPKGVHVAHVVVDGLIWAPQTERRFNPEQAACIEPDEVAKTYLGLVGQHSSAWTQELDLRPMGEQF